MRLSGTYWGYAVKGMQRLSTSYMVADYRQGRIEAVRTVAVVKPFRVIPFGVFAGKYRRNGLLLSTTVALWFGRLKYLWFLCHPPTHLLNLVSRSYSKATDASVSAGAFSEVVRWSVS